MPQVTANGLAFHVQELGAGRPVVMVHGLLVGSLASWYFTAAPALARAGAQHLVLPGGHYLHLEARAALISAIEAHLG